MRVGGVASSACDRPGDQGSILASSLPYTTLGTVRARMAPPNVTR